MWNKKQGARLVLGFEMVVFLVKLARFVTRKEQKSIINDLHGKLSPFSSTISVIDDNWGKLNRIQVKMNINHLKQKEISKIIKKNPGVKNIIIFPEDLFEKTIYSFSELVKTIITFLESNNADNKILLHFKSFGKIPLHKRAILNRLKKKGIVNDPENGFPIYIEMKTILKEGSDSTSFFLRLGKMIISPKTTKSPQVIKRTKLVLFSPFTVQEVADFFRLALTFNTQVIFTNENKKVEILIEKTRKTLYKGIDKIDYKIVDSISKLMKNTKRGIFVGFSLWGSISIVKMPAKLASSNNISNQIFLLFGNEEQGLPLYLRDQIPMFHIGTQASEPLRASQAAAYALGVLKL